MIVVHIRLTLTPPADLYGLVLKPVWPFSLIPSKPRLFDCQPRFSCTPTTPLIRPCLPPCLLLRCLELSMREWWTEQSSRIKNKEWAAAAGFGVTGEVGRSSCELEFQRLTPAEVVGSAHTFHISQSSLERDSQNEGALSCFVTYKSSFKSLWCQLTICRYTIQLCHYTFHAVVFNKACLSWREETKEREPEEKEKKKKKWKHWLKEENACLCACPQWEGMRAGGIVRDGVTD